MRPVKHRIGNKIIPVIVVCGILLAIWQALAGGGERSRRESLSARLFRAECEESAGELLPVLAWGQEGQEDLTVTREALEEWMPGYLYRTQAGQVAVRQPDGAFSQETELTLEELMRLENQEHFTEDTDSVTMLDLESLLAENGWHAGDETEQPESGGLTAGIPDAVSSENAILDGESGGFTPHVRQQTVDLTELQDYETLRNRYYSVDSVTNIGRDLLDVEKLSQRDLSIDKGQEGPQILIYHTHSREGFADSVPGDDSTTIMGVGQHLADILEQRYGYQVLHHLGAYDKETRDNAYSRSLPEITRLLEENPQIQVIIDLHRDAVADESNRLVMDLDGRPTARFMFFNGISWTRRTGSIDYLQNDNLSDNLAFSFQMKLKAEEYYPGLTRRNYINGYRYNMHLRPRTLLIELGAQNNTLEEAMNACDPIAHLLDLVLSGEQTREGAVGVSP